MKFKATSVFVFAVVIASVWQTPNLGFADDYTPGPVVPLHNWLGDQCTFAPDLDVGDCCAEHDKDYQEGGNEFDRWRADVKFKRCIRYEKGRPVVASIYFWGVRLFGWLFFNYN